MKPMRQHALASPSLTLNQDRTIRPLDFFGDMPQLLDEDTVAQEWVYWNSTLAALFQDLLLVMVVIIESAISH